MFRGIVLLIDRIPSMNALMRSNPLSEITPKNAVRSVKSPRGDDSGTTHGGKSNNDR